MAPNCSHAEVALWLIEFFGRANDIHDTATPPPPQNRGIKTGLV